MKKIAILFSAAALLAACAGTSFNWDSARKVQPGMTQQQLTEIMGAPYMVTSRGKNQVWIYSYASTFGGAKSASFILTEGKVVETPAIPDSFK
jgi:outer membrane protein assembly factor BamE (lipoprotein component of BamABCDE complex)